MKDAKKSVVKYLVTIGISFAASLFIMWLRDIGAADTLATQYKILADAFTVPGVILVCFSGIMWVASDGFFDSLGYAFSRVGGMFIPFLRSKHETYYDYKQRKGEKRDEKGNSFWYLFFVGIGFILVSVVFVVLYETV